MNPNPIRSPEPPPPLSRRVGQAIRRYFVTGLATLFPVTVTIWLVITIFNIADRFLGRRLGFQFPGLGLLVTIVVILLVGVLSVHFFGRVLFRTLEAWFTRLPLIKKIYPATKQLSQFLFNEEGRQDVSSGRAGAVPAPGGLFTRVRDQ